MTDKTDMMLEIIRTTADTIGTHMLTIKFCEHDGRLEAAQKLRELNQRLEDQMATMIKLYRNYLTQ